MEAWKIADVPAFEPYVNRFWADLYGLGKCDASNVGEHKKNANETSAFYGMNFVCDKDSGWVANKNEFYGGCDSCSVMRDSRDGHVYKYMNIDGTDWMVSNLRYDNGDYECLLGNCEDYGYLYQSPGATYYGDSFATSVDVFNPARGICPSGWHVPMVEDFSHLINSASDDEKKLLFSEAERDIILATGVDSTSYWSTYISLSRRTCEWRYALNVFSDGSLSVSLKEPGRAFVRCVRD